MTVVARGYRFGTGRLRGRGSSPVPTEPESSPLRLDRRHLLRTSSIPIRYRGSASEAPAGPAPGVHPAALGCEVKKQTLSPGMFLWVSKPDILMLIVVRIPDPFIDTVVSAKDIHIGTGIFRLMSLRG